MSWSDTFDLQNRLDAALSQYQWNAASEVCKELIKRVHTEHTPYPEPAARQVLASLRKKRQLALLAQVAEAFVRFGQNAPRIRRQYAQALIDQGLLLSPEPVLQALTMEPLEGDGAVEVAEAHGLLGRLYKQLYVNAASPSSPYARAFFERAVGEYLQTYRLNPSRNSWHGINVVALLRRGKEDGIDITHAPDATALARAILDTLPEPSKVVSSFDLATRLEALVALGRANDVEQAALDYTAHPDADAFEVASTLRQFEDVWRLSTDTPPGSTILPLLRAAKLRREGGSLRTAPLDVESEIKVVQQAARRLEKTFGEDKTVTLQWYEKGLLQTKAVARIERLNGKTIGTGWVVRSDEFFSNDVFPDGPRLLLLTNAHVVNPDGSEGALTPDDARANFQVLGRTFEFVPRVVWSSPISQMDATFLAFRDEQPEAKPLSILNKKVRFTEPASRVYIIGYPKGGDLRLSLDDNALLGCNERLLHYRTPTEGGSSGSPVFEAEDWRVVGLHHAGGRFEQVEDPPLDGTPPPYDANEGITVRAIKAAIAAAPFAKF
jgi:hypothetical protein